MWRKIFFLPRAPSNLRTPLCYTVDSSQKSHLWRLHLSNTTLRLLFCWFYILRKMLSNLCFHDFWLSVTNEMAPEFSSVASSKIWEGWKTLLGPKMLDFRQVILFCLEYTSQSTKWLYVSNILGAWPPRPSWLRLCQSYFTNMSQKIYMPEILVLYHPCLPDVYKILGTLPP